MLAREEGAVVEMLAYYAVGGHASGIAQEDDEDDLVVATACAPVAVATILFELVGNADDEADVVYESGRRSVISISLSSPSEGT